MRTIGLFLITTALFVSITGCSREEPVASSSAVDDVSEPRAARSIEERIAGGKNLYAAHCAACHQATGKGLTGAFPPLAESSYLSDGPDAAIDVILNGLNGPITVNGTDYNAVMPNLSYLSDSDVADIVTFVMNSWGNPGGDVDASTVAAARNRP